jgi:murein DD-endopeptidase MepM/ murein hydrolase activator NlpD
VKKRKGLFIGLLVIVALAAITYVFKDKLWTVYKGGLTQKEAVNKYDTLFSKHPEYIADGFDYPVGKPDGTGYYDAQPFTKNRHLGSDWNGLGGGNTDIGDPVYAVANGYVTYAKDAGRGWGNIVRVIHCIPGKPNKYIESFYAHLDKIKVKEGVLLKRRDVLGTIGTANGAYIAHLHFELRNKIDMLIGPGYSTDTTGYLNPTVFLKRNRALD